MLYSSEGLISACGLVPSVFGRVGIVERKSGESRVLASTGLKNSGKCFAVAKNLRSTKDAQNHWIYLIIKIML